MKSAIFIIAAAWALLLTGCASGGVLDERIRFGASEPLHLAVGQRFPAMRPGLGFRPPVGGFVPTLVSDDESVVSVRRVADGHDASAVDLVGLRPGRTKVRLANALGLPPAGERLEEVAAFVVEVQ